MRTVQIEKEIYKAPTAWSEVTVRQFYRIRNEYKKDVLVLYSILLGCTVERLETCKQFDLHAQLKPCFEFLDTELKPSKSGTINIAGKERPVPKDLAQYSYAQYLRLYERMAKVSETTGSTVDCIPFAVAVYFQPLVSGEKYSTEKAERFAEEVVGDCPITEAASVGNFFLKILIDSAEEIHPDLRTSRIRNKKLRELVRWMSSKVTIRSTVWPTVTSFSGSKS